MRARKPDQPQSSEGTYEEEDDDGGMLDAEGAASSDSGVGVDSFRQQPMSTGNPCSE
jgi:hypothetical protein